MSLQDNKFAKRITLLTVNANGNVSTHELKSPSSGGKKKKKIPAWARPHEKRTRKRLQALRVYADNMVQLHDRSNQKKSNGWLRDARDNHDRALRKAQKVLQKNS